jgi:D-alanyl-lipoteichoic acid acyltransferase DltB (MBOAT superfamily)
VLPVGISFLTFQEMGYTVDVYRRQMRAAPSLLDYLLFVSYFPHLVAGPIQRSSHLLRQLQSPRMPTAQGVYSGALLILWGLFKKVVVADNLAPYVDAVYAHPAHHSGPTLAFATYLFAFQIYCDFCGYSEMAVGMARIMGIDLIFNFRAPYLSPNIKEFWRRWHISLSTWFRDYLYIPLGGNRVGPARDVVNIMVVFLVSGLWHGANWTFVVWGGLHGVYLAVYRLFGGTPTRRTSPFRRLVSTIITFQLVVLAWVFFRASSMSAALSVLHGFFRPGPFFFDPVLPNGLVPLFLLIGVELLIEPETFDEWVLKRAGWLHVPVAVGLAYAIVLFAAQQGAQFIYFQF